MKNLKFITPLFIVAMFLFACGGENTENNNTENENQNETTTNETSSNSKSFEMLNFDSGIMSEISEIEGDLLYGYKWKDKAGINNLIFTKAEKFVKDSDPEYQDFGDQYVYLKAYHYTGDAGNYKQVRMIQDWNQEPCSTPPFALDGDFIKESITFTDLNENGFAEATFMYSILCASEISPVPTKLMMLENGEKYAIRGNSYIREFDTGGEKNIDFGKADQKLVEHASQLWDKYCTPNPNGNSTDDFAQFWKEFQNAIANNDRKALEKISTKNMKEFYDQNYDHHINDRMRKEVAKATVAYVEKCTKEAERNINKDRLFYYEETGSTFGFWFEKINGKWLIVGPQIGG